MSIYDDMAATADKMLDKFGDIVTLGTKSASGDPWAATVATNTSQILAVIMPVSAEMRESGNVEADAIMYARPATMPKVGDTVTRGDEKWTVAAARAYIGKSVTALVEADLKWAS